MKLKVLIIILNEHNIYLMRPGDHCDPQIVISSGIIQEWADKPQELPEISSSGRSKPPRAGLNEAVEGVMEWLNNYTFKLCQVMTQLQAFQQWDEVGLIILIILHMRKLRHKGVEMIDWRW